MPANAVSTRPQVLMCPPRCFDVQYVINPWMEGNLHSASPALATAQWEQLHAAVSRFAEVRLLEPQPGLPDMVFTANAGLVCNGIAALSRFRCPERRGEEPLCSSWFAEAGLRVCTPPQEAFFEGEGDALFTPDRRRLWAGYGWRTGIESHFWLHSLWGCEVVSLRLVDPCFYHLDTCFAPLANGDLLYYPAAFDASSLASIEEFYPASRRVAVEKEDALRFACNAVSLGNALVLNEISPRLCSELSGRGWTVVQVPLSEFLKAGGAAKCLVLHLGEPS